MSARATCRCGWTQTYRTAAAAEGNARRHVCKKAVRRATRHHRCARCGFEETYQDAGAAEARYWFGRHSCQKQEQAMLRSALREQRLALVDRTPQPCLHKVAQHKHGTYACYVLDKCRCGPCAEANSAYERNRVRQIAYGRWNQRIPASPVREHVRALADAGMGLKTVAKRSGVSHGALWKLMYGKRQADGTYRPSTRVLRETAEKLYALDPDWGQPLQLADGAKLNVEACTPARLKLRSLVRLGWSQSKLATRLGMTPTNFGSVIQGINRMTGEPAGMQVSTSRAIDELFEQLCMTLPPETNQRERISASRARNYAQARGWLAPLDLDFDEHDSHLERQEAS